jgi:hypothetical protein
MNRLAPDATYYHELEVDGGIGLLRWSAHGADGTALLDGGRQLRGPRRTHHRRTIHYRAEQGSPEHAR